MEVRRQPDWAGFEPTTFHRWTRDEDAATTMLNTGAQQIFGPKFYFSLLSDVTGLTDPLSRSDVDRWKWVTNNAVVHFNETFSDPQRPSLRLAFDR